MYNPPNQKQQCIVCGSYNHISKDCPGYEKYMDKLQEEFQNDIDFREDELFQEES